VPEPSLANIPRGSFNLFGDTLRDLGLHPCHKAVPLAQRTKIPNLFPEKVHDVRSRSACLRAEVKRDAPIEAASSEHQKANTYDERCGAQYDRNKCLLLTLFEFAFHHIRNASRLNWFIRHSSKKARCAETLFAAGEPGALT
jgi:hypothetical protein